MSLVRSRWKSAGALGAATLVTLTGCAPLPVDCPAIGWMNSLTVELEGDTSTVATVQLCTEQGCAPAPDIDPSGPWGLVALTDRDGDSWTFSTGMLGPDELSVKALTADGVVISEQVVAPAWRRTGGSEQCGGPATAVVSVTI